MAVSETLFGTRTPPASDAVDSDTVPIELGVRFQAQVDGQVRGVRFYRGAANAAGYRVRLWTAAGGALATANGGDGAVPGWQEIAFATPVTIAKSTTFVASYFTTNGRYAGTNGGFTTALTSGDLTAPAGAGVYHYGSGGGFPTDRFESSNYWVDVLFEPTVATPDTTAPTIAITAPAAGTSVSGTTTVRGTASDDRGVTRVEVQIDGAAPIAATGTTSWQLAWNTAGVANGSHTVTARAFDAAGNAKTASLTVNVANGVGCAATVHNAGELTTAWNAATGGQTICLEAGDYATFQASSKPAVVTLRAQPGVTATMELDFSKANNVRLDGLTITGGELRSDLTKNVTIANSTFTGALRIVNVANANILLDNNKHEGIFAPAGAPPARIHLAYSSTVPSGVTIQRSRFAGGDADGIQTGVGVTILDNEFVDIIELGPNHTDAIQLLGASGAVIRGNYIHRCPSGIVAYDGIDHATIENNVIDLPSRPWGIELYSDDSSVVRHNTLRFGACDFNLPCGLINLNRKAADDAGRGTIVRDNIATRIETENGSTLAARDHNLVRSASTGDIAGTPVFAGGTAPTTYAGYRLATASPGRNAASDGTNIGIP